MIPGAGGWAFSIRLHLLHECCYILGIRPYGKKSSIFPKREVTKIQILQIRSLQAAYNTRVYKASALIIVRKFLKSCFTIHM